MFDKYLNRKVKVLVSSNSGAGISNGNIALGTVFNSVITITGILHDVDNKFIELENSRMVYYSGVANSFVSPLSSNKASGPDVFENEYSMINLDKVISISLISEK